MGPFFAWLMVSTELFTLSHTLHEELSNRPDTYLTYKFIVMFRSFSTLIMTNSQVPFLFSQKNPLVINKPFTVSEHKELSYVLPDRGLVHPKCTQGMLF